MGSVFTFNKIVSVFEAVARGQQPEPIFRGYYYSWDDNPYCVYCGNVIRTFYRHKETSEFRLYDENGHHRDRLFMKICTACHWWQYLSWNVLIGNAEHRIPILSQEPIESDSIPISELSLYLKRNWDSVSSISATKMEELVQGIFKEHFSCEVVNTTKHCFQPDGGIDFILVIAERGLRIAFQVKRRAASGIESVVPVREFIGSLVIRGERRGIYVTSAPRFSRSALEEIEGHGDEIAKAGLEVELINGVALYDYLSLWKPESPLRGPEFVKFATEFGQASDWMELVNDEWSSGESNFIEFISQIST